LLALKRHEVPPPGYFNNFSRRVVEHIRHNESAKGEGVLGTLFAEAPWLMKFVRIFDTRPAVAGSFASVLFLLLVGVIVYTDFFPANNPESMLTVPPVENNVSSPLVAVSHEFFDQSVAASADQVSSTNPVYTLGSADSAFGGQGSMLQPVGFTIH